jgi:hypothetical protein
MIGTYFPNARRWPHARSEYFQTVAAGFGVWHGSVEALYSVIVNVIKRLPAGAVLTGEFENPADPSAPFIVAPESQGKTRLFFASPRFKGIEAKRDYRVIITARAQDGTLIATHTQNLYLDTREADLKKLMSSGQ